MMEDFRQRIPLALHDGGIKPIDEYEIDLNWYEPRKLEDFLNWLETACLNYIECEPGHCDGAVNVYRIDL
jgi:hypothetical protein